MKTKQPTVTKAQLEKIIEKAMKKVGANKENDICRYIPSSAGGYIHHFTMRKMKGENPSELAYLINTHIVDHDKPEKVEPKPRAARGSRKKRDQFQFSKGDIERLLHMARISGDSEMIRKLTPKKDLRSLKKELISSIKRGEVDQELWAFYVEMAATSHAISAFEAHDLGL